MKKIEFKNLPDKTTPINSTNLNKVQDNIENVFNGEEAMGSIVVDDITCKNMLDISNITGKNGITITKNSDGTITFNGTPTSGYIVFLNISSDIFEDGKTYTFSSTNYTNKVSLVVKRTNKSTKEQTYYVTHENSFTVTFDKTTYNYEILIQTDSIATTGTLSNLKIGWQIEKGSVATPYTEYKKFTNPTTKILWTNPDPTVNFPYTASITLSSSDYDEYEVVCYTGTANTGTVSTSRVKAGYNTSVTSFSGYAGNIFGRTFTYLSKTSLRISACYGYGKSYPNPPVEVNDNLIPAYIIGYKRPRV